MASIPPPKNQTSPAQAFYKGLATTNLQVTGLKELGETLRQFDQKILKRIVRKGCRAGAKVILQEVRAKSPKKTGAMAKAFQVTGGGRLKKGEIGVRVQVGKRWFVGDQFYAGFQEFGWRVGKRPGRVKPTWYQKFVGKKAVQPNDERRQIPGKHFTQAATKAKAQAAIGAFVETIRAEIDKAVKESKKGS